MTVVTGVLGGYEVTVREFGSGQDRDCVTRSASGRGGSAGSSSNLSLLYEATRDEMQLLQSGTQVTGANPERAGEIPNGNGEVVLLVEDEPLILGLAKVMLEKLGYCVLAADGAEQAFEIAANDTRGIQLLLTDVLMPGMNGKELAERLQTLYPGLKILFMSGYCGHTIFTEGVAQKGINFMAKPFTLRVLADKVGGAIRE